MLHSLLPPLPVNLLLLLLHRALSTGEPKSLTARRVITMTHPPQQYVSV